MPPVYLDGVRLPEEGVRFVVKAMGDLNETCPQCGGLAIQVKSIFLDSTEGSPVVLTWCSTCGACARLTQDYPEVWQRRILGIVQSKLRLSS